MLSILTFEVLIMAVDAPCWYEILTFQFFLASFLTTLSYPQNLFHSDVIFVHTCASSNLGVLFPLKIVIYLSHFYQKAVDGAYPTGPFDKTQPYID